MDAKAYAEQLDQISQMSDISKTDDGSRPDEEEEKPKITLVHHMIFTGCVILLLCIIELNK
jgi:hypothetical protein